jgi:surfeit locus 1 family protein
MTDKPPRWKRWLVLAVAAMGVAITFSLGLWQLGRAHEKTTLQDARTQQASKEALDGRTLSGGPEGVAQRSELIHRRLVVTGRWLPNNTVHLDNRQMNAKPGFFVLTPLQIEGTNEVLVVQRGWAQRSFTDRTALPPVQTPEGRVQVQGHLAPWPSRLYDFGGAEKGPIRQNLDLTAYRQETGLKVLEVTLAAVWRTLRGSAARMACGGQWCRKAPRLRFQWFGLSGLIALLYVWFQIVQPRRQKRPA